MKRYHLEKLRELIRKAAESLSDTDALDGVELFPPWQTDTDYVRGQRIRYGDLLYRLIPETHHSQADWTPDLVPAVWARIDDPTEEWPEWRQPLGSEDAYPAGAKVSHNEKHWTSDLNANIWEPGVYGWTESEVIV